ncbi:hypothetical protein AB0M44_32740 [Streptosporangium subroseum]|uniref:hypothetical protein n=1 Tax=Streptosporangium subroseum TaxID=106412 RepID=UPI0034136CA7
MTSTFDALRAMTRGLVAPVEWHCPGIGVHPERIMPGHQTLDWRPLSLGIYRVVEHTCSCRAVYYELVSVGGSYQIHKVIQPETPEHAFTGGWTRREARKWWVRLLIGHAR